MFNRHVIHYWRNGHAIALKERLWSLAGMYERYLQRERFQGAQIWIG